MEEERPVITPKNDRFDRTPMPTAEVRQLARQLAERPDLSLGDSLLAALDDPYHARWACSSGRMEMLDFWELHLPPDLATIYYEWQDAHQENDSLANGHHVLRLLGAALEIVRSPGWRRE